MARYSENDRKRYTHDNLPYFITQSVLLDVYFIIQLSVYYSLTSSFEYPSFKSKRLHDFWSQNSKSYSMNCTFYKFSLSNSVEWSICL